MKAYIKMDLSRLAFCAILLWSLELKAEIPPAAERRIDFTRDIEPLLRTRCRAVTLGRCNSTGSTRSTMRAVITIPTVSACVWLAVAYEEGK